MSSTRQQRSRRRLYLSLALMSLAALSFFVMQNRSLLVGGEIAPAKLLWLFAAIFFWFVLPLLIVIDGRGSAAMRRIYAIFLANMCVRALIELYMMYLSQSWHPYYGIGHDAFSILLILLLAAGTGPWRGIDRVLGRNLWVLCAMFVLEICFAWYLLQALGQGSEPIYFVPGDAAHAGVLTVTWTAVAALAVYLWYLARSWLYAAADS